ncbi:hypothetical protein Tco_0776219 [Tanacetum coccineum]
MGILYKSMEVELHGAKGDHEAEVFQVSNDDTVVAQRRLEDKQPEEKTNTDCLVKEQEKEYQTGWNIKTVIMEYLVNISKRRAFWSLNEDILKITILTTNTPMDDLNITMGEYIRLEEEKAQNHITLKRNPAIVFNDNLKSGETLSCEPTVRSLNDEIDFKISFDDFDDEDYTVIFDKNSFSYKIISTNDLKTDSENDNEKVNMPSLPPPKPAVSYFDDLDFFIDFKNEFPAIVYNDAQMSKSDLLTEPTLNPQHIFEFDLKDETSLSEYNEEEQNFLYSNDLFPFNIIQPDDLKSEKDNDDNEIDIKQSLGGNVINTDDGAYAHGIVDMAYSLNEYSVFDTSINTAYTREWIRCIDFLIDAIRPHWKRNPQHWWSICKSGNLEVLES